ncbi:MAG: hypothetical protein P4L76_08810 [Beijerinckiaceae bacterium]|nr:hypothetical protein [Beijerinckiaceae bacterium]
MKASIPLAAAFVVSLVAPAFATDYYVVKDSGSNGCKVIDTAPTAKDDVLGYPTFYQSKSAADLDMKADKACNG